tara:strand:- start:257 stop:553 length:297 start_codon:yes stop_codon:yes gene_type:complete
MTTDIDGGAVTDRFDQIEATLLRYPDIDGTELADLKRWFDKEASALEVASLASKERLRQQYSDFRSAHIDRLGLVEMVLTVLAGILLLGGITIVAIGA